MSWICSKKVTTGTAKMVRPPSDPGFGGGGPVTDLQKGYYWDARMEHPPADPGFGHAGGAGLFGGRVTDLQPKCYYWDC